MEAGCEECEVAEIVVVAGVWKVKGIERRGKLAQGALGAFEGGACGWRLSKEASKGQGSAALLTQPPAKPLMTVVQLDDASKCNSLPVFAILSTGPQTCKTDMQTVMYFYRLASHRA